MKLDSQEQIRKPKTIEEIENKDQKDLSELKKSKKKCLIKILILTFIFIVALGVLLFFLLKNKKKSKAYVIKPDSGTLNKEKISLDEFKKKLSEEKNNSITAVYSLQKDEESVFFNPEKIGLSDKNYEIEILSVKEEDSNLTSTTLRNLDNINYKFLSQITAKIEIRISFYISLTTMFELFKNCANLVEIDLSKLDASNLKNLDSTFENCSNLKFADLNLPNRQIVQSMDNSFNGCEKLENVDLTEFEPKENVSIQNMFKNYVSLYYINMLNFHTYNFGGIFVGCINLLININIDINISQDINDIMVQSEHAVECEIGPGAKCKQCMEGKNSIYCDDCNEGYYIPYKKKRTECIKCQDNCLECFGLTTFSYCYKCKEGFEPINGICEKKEELNEEKDTNKETNINDPIEPKDTNKKESSKPNVPIEPIEDEGTNKLNCIKGKEEKCKSCDLIQPENCGECNEGYYLSEEDKTKCTKCSTIDCKSCPNDICTDCVDDYIINYEVFYPYLTDEQAFNKVFEEMQLRDTFVNKVYCQKHNPERPPNDFNFQIHFVWNKYKRKMIPIDNIYYITDGSARITNNEYLQSVIQEYEFTHIDHIYSKNNKKYTYNNRTLKFDEIPNPEDFEIKCLENQTNISINRACDIGPNEKCKSCDLIHQEDCGECNEGYYLSEEDKTICTKCSMKDVEHVLMIFVMIVLMILK